MYCKYTVLTAEMKEVTAWGVKEQKIKFEISK
jgi:hypothetical protein